jgi:hypothetical protein
VQPRRRGVKALVAVAVCAVVAAAAIGVWKTGSRDTPAAAAARSHDAASTPSSPTSAPESSIENPPHSTGTSERLTTVVQRAAELLRVNGAAWGSQVATGTELSIGEALAQASSVPGDATIAEMEWLRQADRDGMYDPNRPLDRLVQHLEATTITDADLAEHLGPNWPAIVDTFTTVAASGFDDYAAQVRRSPAMRVADALDIRAQLQEQAAATGLREQWARSQDLVAAYFERCISESLSRRDPTDPLDEYIRDWSLAQALAHDAVAAAFFAEGAGADEDQVETLARGLQIVQAPERFDRDGSLTRTVQPGENLSPEDAELLDAEEPFLEDE